MSAYTRFAVELHYTPAEVDFQLSLQDAYWELIHLICEAKHAARIDSATETALAYDAMIAWFRNDAAALAVVREKVE